MTEKTTERSGKTRNSLFMRAAMLLIVLLAASFSAHADKTYWKAVEIHWSLNGGDTITDPEPCEVGVTLDPMNNTLYIASAKPQLYVVSQLEQGEYSSGDYWCDFKGVDEAGKLHFIHILLTNDCGYIYIGLDKDTMVIYKVVDP